MPKTRCLAVAAALSLATQSDGTWSIVLVDAESREVAVGTVTCLTSLDLLAIVPVVVVREGGAAVQAAGDFAGQRRPVIFNGFLNDVPPSELLVALDRGEGAKGKAFCFVLTVALIGYLGRWSTERRFRPHLESSGHHH